METQKIISSVLTAVSGQPTKEKPLSIEDWANWLNLNLHNDIELRHLVKKCADWGLAIKNGEEPRWITIMGASGTGKSHCAKKLWKSSLRLSRLAPKWRGVDYLAQEVYWPKFISEMRSGAAYERFRDMISWPVIFLDDIGAERDTTGFAAEQLNLLLGSRVDRWSIITTNLTLEQLGAIDPRISDRIIRKPNIFLEVNTISHSLRK